MDTLRSLNLCTATTRSNERCQNRALPTYDFCWIPEHRYQVEEARRTHSHSDGVSTHAEGRSHEGVRRASWEEFTSAVTRRLQDLENSRRASWQQSEREGDREMVLAYIHQAEALARTQTRQEYRSLQNHLSGEYRSMENQLSSRIAEQLTAATSRVVVENRRFFSSATDSLKAEGRQARIELERVVEAKLQGAPARPEGRNAPAIGEVETQDLVKKEDIIAAVVQGIRQELKVMIEEEVAASRCLKRQLDGLEVPSNEPEHRRHTIAHEGYSSTAIAEMAKKNQRKAL